MKNFPMKISIFTPEKEKHLFIAWTSFRKAESLVVFSRSSLSLRSAE